MMLPLIELEWAEAWTGIFYVCTNKNFWWFLSGKTDLEELYMGIPAVL